MKGGRSEGEWRVQGYRGMGLREVGQGADGWVDGWDGGEWVLGLFFIEEKLVGPFGYLFKILLVSLSCLHCDPDSLCMCTSNQLFFCFSIGQDALFFINQQHLEHLEWRIIFFLSGWGFMHYFAKCNYGIKKSTISTDCDL